MKKLLSLCLTLCMAFTLAAPALADDGDTSTACIQADDGRVELYNENCPKYQAPLGNEVPADLVPMPVFDMKNAIDNNWEHCTSCSKESPHLISTAADLDKIRTHLSTETTDGGTLNIINGFFQLTNDISFSPADFQSGGAFFRDGKGWLPIGAAASTGETPAAFLGWLDGNGFAIKNLLINNFVGQNGLFTQVRGEYGVENLQLVDFKINPDIDLEAQTAAARFTGALCGFLMADVNNITVKNLEIKAADSIYGGIAGCINPKESNESITVKNCRVSGNMLSRGSQIGGIAGLDNGNTLYDNCEVDFTATGTNTDYSVHYGGLIGTVGSNVAMKNCTVTMALNAQGCGGMAGAVSKEKTLSIENCTVSGTLKRGTVNRNGSFVGTLSGSVAIKSSTCSITGEQASNFFVGTIENGASCTVSDSVPVKIGSVFGGWYPKDGSEDGDWGELASEFTAGNTYYAKWLVKITFDGNGATSGAMEAQEITEGDSSAKLPANGFARTGYAFAGWNTAADGKGDAYTAQGTAPAFSATLYAQWTPNTYTIQFEGGEGAEGATAPVSATYDAPAALTANGFTKPGFNFAGWTAAEGGTAAYADGAQVKNLTAEAGGTVTLYAVWREQGPTVPDTGLALDQTALELEPGDTVKLKAGLTPADATYKYIFWTSSDEAVATVSDSGLVTAMADGAAIITAKSWYGHEAVCTVTVKTPDEPTPPQPVDPWPTEGLAGFVTRCYRVALGRDPDKAGHADWVRWLQDGTVDATACTSGFVFSKEMNNKNLSDEDFVKTLYRLFMDREGEAAGVAFWTEYLQAGHSREEVFHGFADSAEFGRIKANYGIQ